MNGPDIQYSRGQRYLGGFIGSNASKVDWFGGMVTTWVAAVETLASVAGNYPQAAYAGFTFCLQNEWQYMQRVTSDTATHFAPLEVAIRTKFLPALLRIATSDLDGEFRELLTHGVKTSGITIRNPVDTAVHVHETSLCLEMRKDFTPLVYSVDGIAGREAKNAEKRLACHLLEKWHKQLPQMVYYVRIRMAIAVVRANSLLIRGSRDRQRPRRPVISDRHAMNDWRTWSEQ